MKIKITETRTKELYVAPCIKCGSDNIIIGDCGYSSFNVAYGKCKNCCKNDISFQCDWNINKKEIIQHWNSKNDINLVIKSKEKFIKELQKEISKLKSLQIKRNHS